MISWIGITSFSRSNKVIFIDIVKYCSLRITSQYWTNPTTELCTSDNDQKSLSLWLRILHNKPSKKDDHLLLTPATRFARFVWH